MRTATVETKKEKGEVMDRRTKTGVRELEETVYVVILPNGVEYRDHDGYGFASHYAADSYASGFNAGLEYGGQQ